MLQKTKSIIDITNKANKSGEYLKEYSSDSKKSNLEELLQSQIDHEFDNERLYLSMAIWCDHHGYYETAKFFSKHTLEERKHGYDFLNFMLKQKMHPMPPKAIEVQHNFEDMETLLKAALAREKKTSKMIGEIHSAALNGGSLALTIAIKYLNEQTEEEQLFNSILELFKTSGGNKADFEMMVMEIKDSGKFKPGKLYDEF